MSDRDSDFLVEVEKEISQPGKQVLPKLKGLYRAMISINKGYWDPKMRRTKEDFGDLSPTKLIAEDGTDGVILSKDRPRFQNWFLIDSAAWPDRSERPNREGARRLLERMQIDARWAGAVAVFAKSGNTQSATVSGYSDSRRERYFDALKAMLRCKAEIQDELAKRAPGIYVVYRPSIVYPKRYVRGLMACFVDTSSHALRTVEVHCMTRENAGFSIPNDSSHPEEAAPELEDILVGYMVQKSRIIQMHSVDLITRSFNLTYIKTALRGPAFPRSDGEAADTSRFAILDDERAGGFPSKHRGAGLSDEEDLLSPYAVLSGVASGTVGGSFFAYPCVYIRLAGLPKEPGRSHHASTMFDLMRAKDYADIPGLVSQVPDFVLEQLRLCQPPFAALPGKDLP